MDFFREFIEFLQEIIEDLPFDELDDPDFEMF